MKLTLLFALALFGVACAHSLSLREESLLSDLTELLKRAPGGGRGGRGGRGGGSGGSGGGRGRGGKGKGGDSCIKANLTACAEQNGFTPPARPASEGTEKRRGPRGPEKMFCAMAAAVGDKLATVVQCVKDKCPDSNFEAPECDAKLICALQNKEKCKTDAGIADVEKPETDGERPAKPDRDDGAERPSEAERKFCKLVDNTSVGRAKATQFVNCMKTACDPDGPALELPEQCPSEATPPETDDQVKKSLAARLLDLLLE